MDERVFHAKVGHAIPEWDYRHRLPISGCIGPELRDSGTIFRINSTFMDVSDQPHMIRHWLACASLIACLSMLIFLYAATTVLIIYPPTHGDAVDIAMVALVTLSPIFFGFITVKLGREEFFSLTRRPIRFNRKNKKIYAIRKREHTGGHITGDICCEVPWGQESMFCVHKGPAKLGLHEHYHIRCYRLDAAGNVLSSFALGREWQGTAGMRDLLAQWNYWCDYMNIGPEKLPRPLLYLSEYEDLSEAISYCGYGTGSDMGKGVRTFYAPFAIFLSIFRMISMSTCRQPVWPDEVLDVSRVAISDPYDEPKSTTPVGWVATEKALVGLYLQTPFGINYEWNGDSDPIANAQRWQGNGMVE